MCLATGQTLTCKIGVLTGLPRFVSRDTSSLSTFLAISFSQSPTAGASTSTAAPGNVPKSIECYPTKQSAGARASCEDGPQGAGNTLFASKPNGEVHGRGVLSLHVAAHFFLLGLPENVLCLDRDVTLLVKVLRRRAPPAIS